MCLSLLFTWGAVVATGVLVLRELDTRYFAYTRSYSKEVFLHRLQYYKVACARWVSDLSFTFQPQKSLQYYTLAFTQKL
jgi:hypothetical protein